MDKKWILLVFIFALMAIIGITFTIGGYNAAPPFLKLNLSSIQILGLIVGIVVTLALVIFLFVRFQAIKMAT